MKKIVVCLSIIFCVALLCSCASSSEKSNSTSTVSTPYANLYIPDSYKNNVVSEVTCNDPYTLTFKTKSDNVPLFAFIFGGTGDSLIGTIAGDKGNTTIYLNIFDLDPNLDKYNTYCSYQEEVNTVIEHLISDYTLATGEAIEHDSDDVFSIDTSLATFYYPIKWKDTVSVEVNENGVRFSSKGTSLFDLMFQECDGYLLGTLNDTPIYVVLYPTEDDNQAAMQEDINVILDYLKDNPYFAAKLATMSDPS